MTRTPGHRVRMLLAALLAVAAHAGDATEVLATEGPAYVPVSRRADLQAELVRHVAIELDADADYAAPGARPIQLRSGQRITGGWNTHLPLIIIPGGVSDVRVTAVRGDGGTHADVLFTGGEPNRDVVIVGGNGGRAGGGERLKVKLMPGSQVDRLSLTEFGGLELDQRSGGYIRNSVFSRLLGYWPGPQLQWSGNPASETGGNAFLGVSLVTPASGARWRDVGDLWLVGADCESWNEQGAGWKDCFTIDGARSVVAIGLGGGTAYPAQGGALARLRNVDRLVTLFQHGHGGARAEGDFVVESTNAWLDAQNPTIATLRDDRAATGVRGEVARAGEAIDAASRLRGVSSAGLPSPLVPSPVPKPVRRTITEPLAPGWRARLAGQADATLQLQAAIDARGVARVEPGIYYLHSSLRAGSVDRVEGLIGARGGRVVLVATGDFPIIRGRAGGKPGLVRLVYSGLTLLGGSHGIRWSAEPGDLGPGAPIAWSTFADLAFLHQSVAGVEATGIGGLDSNLWMHVDFYDVPVAVRGVGSGTGPGMNYADKQLFLDCQFQRVAGAAWDWQSDRPSGGEVWQDDVYSDVGQVSRTRAATSLLWYNSVFEDVRGTKGIEVTDAGTATYYFSVVDSVWRGVGPTVVSDTQSFGIGTLFVNTVFAQRGGSLVGRTGRQVLSSWGSAVTGDAVVGAVRAGLFIDSRLPAFDRRLQVVGEGRTTILDATVALPTVLATGVAPR